MLSPSAANGGARLTREPTELQGTVAFRVSLGALRGIAAISGRIQANFPIELTNPAGSSEPRVFNNRTSDGPIFALYAPQDLTEESLVTLLMPESALREGAEFEIHIDVAADELGRNRIGKMPVTLKATFVRNEWRVLARSR